MIEVQMVEGTDRPHWRLLVKRDATVVCACGAQTRIAEARVDRTYH